MITNAEACPAVLTAIHDAEAVVHDHVHAHSCGHDHGLP